MRTRPRSLNPSYSTNVLYQCIIECGRAHCHLTLVQLYSWAEARIKIARMTLTNKLDGNWSSFQLANNTPPLSVTGSVIAPSARMPLAPHGSTFKHSTLLKHVFVLWFAAGAASIAEDMCSSAAQVARSPRRIGFLFRQSN